MNNTGDIEKKFDLKKFLFGKIFNKFVVYFFIIIICMGVGGFFLITSISQNQLETSIGDNSYLLAQETMSQIDMIIETRLEQTQAYAQDISQEELLHKSNLEFDLMSNRDSYISKKESEWINAGSTLTPFMLDLIGNNLSNKIRNEFQLADFYTEVKGYPIFSEVFVTNKYGVNVAQTEKTSDYSHADEEWWQIAKENGTYVEDISYDESSGIDSLSFSVAIKDDFGNFAGVMKVVYNIQEIRSLVNEFQERKRDFTKREIKDIAVRVADEINEYLVEHPNMTVEDLQASKEFQKIAVQPVGKTGYTAVTDYDSLIARFHKKPSIVNLDLHVLKDKLPGFWSVMSRTEGGVEADGFYEWQEPDGKITEKYMYIALVDTRTADGVGFHVAATAYADEFKELNYAPEYKLLTSGGKIIYSTTEYKILQDYSENLVGFFGKFERNANHINYAVDNENEKLLVHAHSSGYRDFEGLRWIFLIEYDTNEIFAPIADLKKTFLSIVFSAIVVLLFVGFYLSKKITKPIEELTDANLKIQDGHFDTRVDIKTGDELQMLGESFNKTTRVLEDTNKERKRLDKAKTEFLSITSHELRSPMTPMRAQLQMLLENYFGKLNSKQKESIEIVLRNTERLDGIIQDFLEISRIEAARLKFNFKKIYPAKVALNIVKEMKAFMPEKKIALETKLEKLPIIEADPDRIGQVLRNLINNAMKFTPEGGKIVVEGKMQGERILFSVQDNGIGIKEKDQQRLFEPFYQADNMYQHKSGGTGLGLAICRGIVESQGGKIWIESKEGEGSKFLFTIPLESVKDVRPIKLLFSAKDEKDVKVKEAFVKMLGPLGEKEFEYLKKSKGILEKSLLDYFKMLENKGILSSEKIARYKSKIISLYRDESGVSSEDLVKKGLIKNDDKLDKVYGKKLADKFRKEVKEK